ncbi:endo-1,4-beta-glucanase [Elasticomyces elasticus]|nr:endo-1,4-beta-glucanase [Elasticomyces elasticus]
MTSLRLRIDGRTFRDRYNREVTLHGINVAGDAKLPARPEQTSHDIEGFFEGDKVSFVGRPFTVEDAHTHFSRLRKWGFNTIRYIFTWEAIEHEGPGKYDAEWIGHTITLLRLAKEYDFYIFMDPHQDVWSRFTGGSGAPMWTLYACGLDPKFFAATQAALVQNTWPRPEEFPKMIWATNYTRYACQVLFTFFFSGRDFAPKAIIDGKNIQDYLTDHFVNACKHLAQKIRDAGDLERDVVIGWESMNEPNRGLVGWPDLSTIPASQKLQKGTSPTAWQAMLTASGRSCEIDTWDFGGLGPYKAGTELVDPKGQTAWLTADYDDSYYGWKRDPGWKLGECIWAQHGVWDPSSDELLKKDYFSKVPMTRQKIDQDYWTNNYFMEHWRKYKAAIRSVFPEAIMFMQPSPFEIPPSIKNTKDDDPNMVFASHFYDGITLITKKWNRFWNVDVLGILRGRYLSPAFAIKVGEGAIRNCFRDQLAALQQEGIEYMGIHPIVFTEIGIPYDMDNQYAYKTGDYTSQTLALDANHYALEGSKAQGFTLWVYTAKNNHYWGDNWNGEDLSIYSCDDRPIPLSPSSGDASKTSSDPMSPSYSESRSSDVSDVTPSTLNKALSVDRMSTAGKATANSIKAQSISSENPGFRAAEAYVRPTPITTHGDIVSYGFDLRNCIFTLVLKAPTPTNQDAPTECFLPEFHFPRDTADVQVTGGRWSISTYEEDRGLFQRFEWWHAEGEQKVTIKGVRRRQALAMGKEEEDGYVEQCRQRGCIVM